MLISQVGNADGSITVVVREEGGRGRAVKGAESVHALAMEAANGGQSLKAVIDAKGLGAEVDLEAAYAEGRLLSPITHPDAAHLHLTGTGLTHLGSAATRDSMHKKAAKLSGINTERLTFYTFVNMGALAALAGMIIAARLNSATPKAGVGFELDVIAACFIGGASASGGVGKITGAVIGAFIMGVMNNGMSIMGLGIDYQQLVKGLVLLAAVFFDVYNKNKG